MAETYVVTGGAGFIGSNIAEHLLRRGHQVRIIDNLLSGRQENIDFLKSLNGDLELHLVSITDPDAIKPIFKGVDYVFHQAALPSVPRSITNPLETHEQCATGTLNVLIGARDAGVQRVIYAASSSAYGEIEGDYHVETMAPQPISPYGAAKLAGEHYCQAFSVVYDIETVALRYFNVFGPRQDPKSQYSAVIPIFVSMMLKGESPIIYGDGEQSRDFIYIDNVVHGNMLASRAPDANGQVMNMATSGRISLLDLVDKINHVLGTDIKPIHAEARSGDIKHSRASIEKSIELLDFAPVVDFDEGLMRTIAHYKEHGGM